VGGYGLLNKGRGEYKKFSGSRFKKLEEIDRKVSGIEGLDKSIGERVKEIFSSDLIVFEDRFEPVLVHGDAGPDNAVITPDGGIVLVDWDGARGDFWLWDWAILMYSGSHVTSQGSRNERERKIFDNSLEIQECKDFSKDELRRMINAFFVYRAYELLPYYYFDQKNMDAYESTKNRLVELLDK
jgi:thiamine kinase-like enzyme